MHRKNSFHIQDENTFVNVQKASVNRSLMWTRSVTKNIVANILTHAKVANNTVKIWLHVCSNTNKPHVREDVVKNRFTNKHICFDKVNFYKPFAMANGKYGFIGKHIVIGKFFFYTGLNHGFQSTYIVAFGRQMLTAVCLKHFSWCIFVPGIGKNILIIFNILL